MSVDKSQTKVHSGVLYIMLLSAATANLQAELWEWLKKKKEAHPEQISGKDYFSPLKFGFNILNDKRRYE